MSKSAKYDREYRPATYWADDEEPVLQLVAAIPDGEERQHARELFHERRFDDLEALLTRKNLLLSGRRINKELEPLADIDEETLEEFATEPVALASVDPDGYLATLNIIEAVRIGWTIHYRHRIDTRIEEELEEGDQPLTLGKVADYCIGIASELRSRFAEEHETDELEGKWRCYASGGDKFYPGLDALFEEDEQKLPKSEYLLALTQPLDEMEMHLRRAAQIMELLEGMDDEEDEEDEAAGSNSETG